MSEIKIKYVEARQYANNDLMNLSASITKDQTIGTNNHNGGLTAKYNDKINNKISNGTSKCLVGKVNKLIVDTSKLISKIADGAEKMDKNVSL